MKKSWLIIFFWALAYAASAQRLYRHEAQITGFRVPDGEKDHFLQVGYYYNFSRRHAIGARVSYHAEQQSAFYQKQIRYFEVSHRWQFQKPEQKLAWTLSSGPWMQIFTSQSPGLDRGDHQTGSLGVVATGGLHYHIVPRLSIGAVGLGMLEVFSWELSGDRGLYPLIMPGIGVQLAYAW